MSVLRIKQGSKYEQTQVKSIFRAFGNLSGLRSNEFAFCLLSELAPLFSVTFVTLGHAPEGGILVLILPDFWPHSYSAARAACDREGYCNDDDVSAIRNPE
jgi:hypothetical protein